MTQATAPAGDKPVKVADLIRVMRDFYDGTPYARAPPSPGFFCAFLEQG